MSPNCVFSDAVLKAITADFHLVTHKLELQARLDRCRWGYWSLFGDTLWEVVSAIKKEIDAELEARHEVTKAKNRVAAQKKREEKVREHLRTVGLDNITRVTLVLGVREEEQVRDGSTTEANPPEHPMAGDTSVPISEVPAAPHPSNASDPEAVLPEGTTTCGTSTQTPVDARRPRRDIRDILNEPIPAFRFYGVPGQSIKRRRSLRLTDDELGSPRRRMVCASGLP